MRDNNLNFPLKILRNYLRRAALFVIALSARLVRKRKTIPRSALICPPAPPGSIGDAAMVMALREQLRLRGYEQVAVVDHASGSWGECAFEKVLRMPESRLNLWIAFARQLRNYECFFVIGADCLDGVYSPALTVRLLDIAAFAARAGCITTVCGSSFNTNPEQLAINALRCLPQGVRLLARDPQSLGRMAKISSFMPELVGDLAFLLNPDTSLIPQAQFWITSSRDQGRVILGVNVANAPFRGFSPGRTGEVVNRIIEALDSLLRERASVAVLMIPHDIRGAASDLALCRVAYEHLHETYPERVSLFEESWDPRALKAVAGMLDACMTCRMHLAIACLGSGVPIGAIPYQDKFEGLFDHFLINPPRLQVAEIFQPGKVEQFLREILTNAPSQRAQILKRKEEVHRLALLNLDQDGARRDTSAEGQ